MYRKEECVRTRERRRKQLMLIAEAICCVVLAVIIGCILLRHWKHQQRMQEQSEAQEILAVLNEENAASEAAEAQSVSANVSATTPPVFAAAQQLLDQNPDFVGMVGFDDMVLYVCQSTDNTFYASHRFDGSSDAAGMIYMDCRCSVWPLSDGINLTGKRGSLLAILLIITLLLYSSKGNTFTKWLVILVGVGIIMWGGVSSIPFFPI